MNTTARFLLLAVCCSTLLLGACKKCKDCYFIEEVNGYTNEFPLGEFCGSAIEAKENDRFAPTTGKGYNKCR